MMSSRGLVSADGVSLELMSSEVHLGVKGVNQRNGLNYGFLPWIVLGRRAPYARLLFRLFAVL